MEVHLWGNRAGSLSWGDNSLIKHTVPQSQDRASSNGQSLYSVLLEEQGKDVLDARLFPPLRTVIFRCKVENVLGWEVKESPLRQ